MRSTHLLTAMLKDSRFLADCYTRREMIKRAVTQEFHARIMNSPPLSAQAGHLRARYGRSTNHPEEYRAHESFSTLIWNGYATSMGNCGKIYGSPLPSRRSMYHRAPSGLHRPDFNISIWCCLDARCGRTHKIVVPICMLALTDDYIEEAYKDVYNALLRLCLPRDQSWHSGFVLDFTLHIYLFQRRLRTLPQAASIVLQHT